MGVNPSYCAPTVLTTQRFVDIVAFEIKGKGEGPQGSHHGYIHDVNPGEPEIYLGLVIISKKTFQIDRHDSQPRSITHSNSFSMM